MDFLKAVIFLNIILCSTEALSDLPVSLDNALTQAKTRCLPETNNNTSSKKLLFTNWFLDWEQMDLLFNESYRSPQRLSHKTYYNPTEDTFIMPFFNHLDQHNQGIRLTNNFIANIILHIETALENHYADYINFSDLGHSHLLIPQGYYRTILPLSKTNRRQYYEKTLAYRETKFLYHTAEQLQMIDQRDPIKLPDDRYLRHRYLTRNIIGNNNLSTKLTVVQVKDLTKDFNTVRSIEKYISLVNGHYISSHKDGCFPYKKEHDTYYFDINFIQ